MLTHGCSCDKGELGSRLEVQEYDSVHALQEYDRCFQEEVRVGAAKAGAQSFIVGASLGTC